MKLYTDKAGFIQFYILMPIIRRFTAVKKAITKVSRKDKWYCDDCKKYHSGRIVAYYSCTLCDGVCYMHTTPSMIQDCECILLGGKDITNEIKAHFEILEPAIKHHRVNTAHEIAEAYRAGETISRFCNRQNESNCKGCPISYMCNTPPYIWDQGQKEKQR